MSPRLSHASSPYLLQHAHHPVDWEPWDEVALARARAEDTPIFLSVGYSACHWCHVMARESFEDPETARLLNAHFVPIKVDREERPDLDEIYQDAAAALTGRGGWPLSVWLTPDLEPFYAGTYFPPKPRWGSPGFRQVLERIRAAWAHRRPEVQAQGRHLREALERMQVSVPDANVPEAAPALREAMTQLRYAYDPDWGGFGPAPKFPPHQAIHLILRRGGTEDRAMARRTLDAMAAGGLHDHLGGGFARYSVDARWQVPHFEKMLYDQALLALCYLESHQAGGLHRDATVARKTLDYLLRDLRDPCGAFHSSEDADSEGAEGRFYTWTLEELCEVLGPEEGHRFAEATHVRPKGHLEDGRSVLHLSLEDLTEENPVGPASILEANAEALRRHRETRPRPGRDDKVVAAWNGLALRALVRGWEVLGDPRYREAALACAGFLQEALWRNGALFRTWRRGVPGAPGLLEDYAALALGALDLYEATFEPGWLAWAEALAAEMRARFEDLREGGFFSAEAGRGDLLFRPRHGFDGATPGGNTLALELLLRLGWRTRDPDLLRSAERLLAAFGPILRERPRATLGLLELLAQHHQGPVEVEVAEGAGDPRHTDLLPALRRRLLPGRLLVPRPPEAGPPQVQVCFRGTCWAPSSDPSCLEAQLDNLSRVFPLEVL